MNTSLQSTAFWSSLRDVNTIAEVTALMREVDERETALAPHYEIEEPTAEAADFFNELRPRLFRRQSIQKLRDLAGNDTKVIREIMVSELLPRCLRWMPLTQDQTWRESMVKGTRTIRPSRESDLAWETQELREELEVWLWQMPQKERESVREELLNTLCRDLQDFGAPIEAARAVCWTINSIGYRSPEVEAALWEAIKQRDDLAGDTALSVLASMGGVPLAEDRVPEQHDLREKFLAELRARLQVRPHRFLGYTLCVVASPDLGDAALALFHSQSSEVSYYTGQSISPDEQTQQEKSPDLDDRMKHTLLAQFANELPEEEELQERIWRAIFDECNLSSSGRGEILYQSNLLKWCNARDVVPDVTDLTTLVLAEHESDTSSVESESESEVAPQPWTIYIASSRLQDAVRPQHLRGWAELTDEQLSPFRASALVNTRQSGYQTTSVMRVKEGAWETLALAGGRWDSQDIERAVRPESEGIEGESSGFVREEIMKIAAWFARSPLPPSVAALLKRPHNFDDSGDNSGDTSEFAAYSGAEILARATADLQAFDALLDSGFLFRGSILQSTGEALSEVAVTLVRSGETGVLDRLVEAALTPQPQTRRITALPALCALAVRGLFPSEQWRDLLTIGLDETLPEYQRAFVVRAIGHIEGVGEAAHAELLQMWRDARRVAAQRENTFSTLVNYALESLVRHGTWREDAEELLEHLNLQKQGKQWHLEGDRMESDVAPSLAALYEQEPAAFETALCEALSIGSGQAHYALLFHLSIASETRSKKFSPAIVDILLDQATQMDDPWHQRLYLFGALATAAPIALLSHSWQEHWTDWNASAKVALANAVEQAAKLRVGTTDENWQNLYIRAAGDLKFLLSDESYAVRRATARAISRLSPEVLKSHAQSMADALDTKSREQAASVAPWIEAENSNSSTDSLNVSHLLRRDRESRVREAIKRELETKRNRKWADAYLEHVLQTVDTSTLVKNVAFGAALTQLGDESHINSLARAMSDDEIAPHIRVWLQHLHKKTLAQWEETTQKWPKSSLG